MKTITLKAWLVFSRGGISKMTKNSPSLYAGEKAIQIVLNIPVSVFREPDLVAEISLVDDLSPAIIRSEVEARVRDALIDLPEIFVDFTKLEQGD